MANGFGSVEEMLKSRAFSIAAFRESILTCDLLVFTLGLTESWWDATEGVEYPICSGIRAGQFDAKRHVFRNQDYGFVRERLERVISLIRKHRTVGPDVLLTVSPVPLVATCSGNHVLVATMESKSILRAVAGNLASSLESVSYFPSYEIVNSPVFRGSFFEPDLRSVSTRGVAHVMDCFFAGVGEGCYVQAGAAPARDLNQGRQEDPSPDDLICEEELLGAFGCTE